MNHTRLSVLLQSEQAPNWFANAVTKALHSLEYGQPFRDAAQGLWQLIREGHNKEDAEILRDLPADTLTKLTEAVSNGDWQQVAALRPEIMGKHTESKPCTY